MSILDAYKEMTGEDLSGRPQKSRDAAIADPAADEQARGSQEANILTAFEDMQRERASLRQAPAAPPAAATPAASARPEAIPSDTETQPAISFGDAAKREADYLGTSLKRGWNTIVSAVAGSNLNKLEQLERDLYRFRSEEDFARDPELRASRDKLRDRMLETAQTIRDVSKENDTLLNSQSTRPETKLLYGVGKDERGWVEAAKDVGSAIISNPMSLVDLGLGSGPASLASAASAVAVTLSTKNPVAGATAGGLTSGYVEFGNEYAQQREAGLSHEEAWSKAARKASVVGLLDGVSMSTAGKALDAILDATKGTVAKTALAETVKETGRQAALGAAGEAGGSLLAGEPISPTNVLLEAVGETVTAPIEAVSTARGIFGETAAAESRREDVARRAAVRALDPNRDVAIDPIATVRPSDSVRDAGSVEQQGTAVPVVADPPEQPPADRAAQPAILPDEPVAKAPQAQDTNRSALSAAEDDLIRELDAQAAAQAAPAPEAPQTFVSAVESIKADLGVDAADALNLTEVTNDTRLNRFKGALESAFGVTVHWVDFGDQLTTASGKQLGAFSGYRKDNTILVGAKDVDFLDTTWHELTHVLETRYPDVYRALRDTVVPAMDPTVRDQLVKSLNERRQQEVGRDLSATELDSELVAYVVGDQVRNPQLLGQMFDSFDDPQVAKTFRDVLNDIIAKLLSVIKGPQYIRERARLVEAQKSITTAFAEFQKRETQKRMAAPVQPATQATTQPAARPVRRNPFLDDEPPAPKVSPTGLPQDLAGAKPRYAIGTNQFDLDFESDIDKAAFITSQSNKSKRDADYRAWLRSRGLNDVEIAKRGQAVRAKIKAQATGKPSGRLAVTAEKTTGEPNATQVREVQQDRIVEREGTGRRLEEGRVDRQQPPEDQAAGDQAGGRDQPEEGGAQQEVTGGQFKREEKAPPPKKERAGVFTYERDTRGRVILRKDTDRARLLARNIGVKPSAVEEDFIAFRAVDADKVIDALANAPKVDPKIAKRIQKQLNLSDAELASTSLRYQTGKPKEFAFVTPVLGGIPETVQFLEQSRRESGLRLLDIGVEADQDTLARLIAAETMAAINSSGNALEWYDETIAKTLAMASVKYPELANDPYSQSIFRLGMAISSQGLNVENNLRFAMKQYEEFRKNNRFPEVGEGESAGAMVKNFKLANQLLEQMGPDLMRRFLATPFTVGELKAAGYEADGELIDENILGSSVFGPKIGFGFYSNLNGNFEPVTMDMWFMRTLGRLTGYLRAFDAELFAEQLQSFRDSFDERGENAIYADRFDPELVERARVDSDSAIELARQVKRAHEKDFKDNRADFDAETRKKSPLVYAADRIIVSVDKPKDAPSNGTERRNMRAVVQKAVAEVERVYGRRVPPAAMQALIWYPEQELYKSFGVKLTVTSQDYAGATEKVLKEEGYDEQRLRTAAELGSRSARQAASGNVGQRNRAARQGAQRPSPVQGSALDRRERERFLVSRTVQRYRAGNAQAPRAYEGKGSGDVRRIRGLDAFVRAEFKPRAKFKNALAAIDKPAPALYELVQGEAAFNGAARFRKAISDAKSSSKHGAAVYVYDEADYAKMRLFLTEDGKSGFALKGDDIVSVFSGQKGSANAMLQLAVDEGGRRLDAFDTILPEIYADNGFKTVARVAWNEDYKPDNWDKQLFKDFNNGEPDVVFMVYDPANASESGGEVIDSYENGAAAQDSALGGGQFARRVPTQGQRFTLPERTARELTSNALRNRMSRVAAVQRAVVDQGGTIDIRDAQGSVVEDTDITRATEAMSNAAAARLEGFRDRTVIPLIEDAAKLGVNLDEVAQYLYAVYAPERNAVIQQRNPTQFATDGGSGMTNAEAATIVRQFRARPDFPEIEQIAQRFSGITRMTQDVLLSEGLVDPLTMAQWRTDNPNYVPLRGFEQVDENTGDPLKGGDNPGRLDPRNPFVKTAKGRQSKAGDILENIFKDYEDAVVLAEKNLVYRRLLQFVRQNPDPKLWEVDATVQRRTYRKGALTLTGQTQGQVSVSYDIEDSPANTIAVRIKGRPIFIKINDPGMLDDLQMNMFRIDNEQGQKVFEAWQAANNVVKKTYTSLNPVFVVKELARSSEQVLLWNATKYGAKSGAGRAFKKLVKSAKAAYKAERDNNWAGNNDTITIRQPGQPARTISVKEAYEMFKADGGKTAFLDIRSVDDIRDEIARRFSLAQAASTGDPRRYHKRVANALLSAEEAIIEFVSVTDNAFRFATYMARLEAGNTRQEAADAARNVTVNHAAKGKMTPLFGAAYMFFNPAVQGAENTFRAAFRTGWRGRVAVGSMIALGLMMAEMQSQISGDDDEPYWDKELYKQAKLRNIPIFNENGDMALIPLLYGWGFFVNLGYAMHDMARGVPAAKVGAFIRDSFFTHFSPLGSLENPGTFFAPTMLDPVMVISNNKTDQGIPLMPDSPWNEGQPDSEKFWGSTRGTMFQQTARLLNTASGGNPYESGYVDISPETMRYMFGFLTGGTGGFVRDASESIYLSTELGAGTAFDKNKIPLLKSFFVKNTGKADQVQFYRNSKEATDALRKMNDLYGTEYELEPRVAQRLAERQFLAELGNAVDSYKDALAVFRQDEIDIMERRSKGELTPQAAEMELKLIAEQKSQLYIDFNREFYLLSPDTPE